MAETTGSIAAEDDGVSAGPHDGWKVAALRTQEVEGYKQGARGGEAEQDEGRKAGDFEYRSKPTTRAGQRRGQRRRPEA